MTRREDDKQDAAGVPNRWAVTDAAGRIIADGFTTNAAAWSWIDGNTDEGRDDADRHNRIRDAFAVR